MNLYLFWLHEFYYAIPTVIIFLLKPLYYKIIQINYYRDALKIISSFIFLMTWEDKIMEGFRKWALELEIQM